MKIFLDTADTSIISKHYETGLVDGVTTNPPLIRKSGRDPEEVYQELIDIGIPDISMEVVGNADDMLKEGLRLSKKFGAQATIKVPCSPEGLYVCKKLSENGIKVNVTLIFSVVQAILAAKAGATYVSPFVGRLNDNSFSGVALVQTICSVYKEHFVKTEVLAASIREAHTVGRCFDAGADICTLPPSVLDKMYKHVLTDKGLELFDADWEQVIEKIAGG